jgi:hypothetical protein
MPGVNKVIYKREREREREGDSINEFLMVVTRC